MSKSLIALALLLACSACGQSPPASFENRSRLTSCGDVEFTLGVIPTSVVRTADGGVIPTSAVECMNEARSAGTGAELIVRKRTVEGDPFTEYYRVVPPDPGIEIFADYTQDKFGQRGWVHQQCPRAVSVTELGDCQIIQ